MILDKDIINKTKLKGFQKREGHWNWKGGIQIDDRGYERILRPHHKFANSSGRVRLSRYLMELDLGRYLTEEEVVHHKDKNKKNNSPENLMLFEDNATHLRYENTQDFSDRICSECGTDKTLIRKDKPNNRPKWNRHPNDKSKIVCFSCYKKIKYRNKKKGVDLSHCDT